MVTIEIETCLLLMAMVEIRIIWLLTEDFNKNDMVKLNHTIFELI